MSMGAEGGFIERISVPYLMKFADYLSAAKDGLITLRKGWTDFFPDERRMHWIEIKQNYKNALITAKATALNIRIRLDDRLGGAKLAVRARYQAKLQAFKAAGKTKVGEVMQEYTFDALEAQLVELERTMQPYMLLTPQSVGYDLLEQTIEEVLDETMNLIPPDGPRSRARRYQELPKKEKKHNA